MLGFLFKWLALLCLTPGAWGVVQANFLQLNGQKAGDWISSFSIALIATLLFRFWLHRRSIHNKRNDPLRFWDTLEHELTHALAGMFFFKAPRTLKASDAGEGYLELGNINPAILLAPYCLPLWTGAWALFSSLLSAKYALWIHPVLGLLYGSYLFRLSLELHLEQSDLKKAGWIFSLLTIPIFQALTVALVLREVHRTGVDLWSAALGGWKEVPEWVNLFSQLL